MRDLDAWLKNLVSTLDTADRPLADEVRQLTRSQSLVPPAASASRRRSGIRQTRQVFHESLRNIVLRVGRPVLAIVRGAAQLEFRDSESAVWRSRLQASSKLLVRAAGAVGRIEVVGLPPFQYVGTGWLVEKNILVTNRHVAREFARRSGDGFTFKKGSDDRPISASIDFLEEVGRPQEFTFPIVEILHIEDDDGPDFALLRLKESGGHRLAAPIPLAASPARPKQQVAVMGYPARDRRAPDEQLVRSIFGDVYDKKRLAPGQVTEARADLFMHDCSTLGGNSGSVVLDLASGDAVGLHFAGRFLEANYAVPASVVAERLHQMRHPQPPGRPVGRPRRRPPPPPVITTPATAGGTDGDSEPIIEGVPEDYVGRTGYDARFIGVDVPLPVVRNTSDVLTFPWDGHQETELKYQHFSVVMSRSRRLCIFSAGNIDGSAPRRFKRPSWRLDPRIPTSQQIRDECYGNEPKFARGHMTRREDPVWGGPEEAALGNRDSMHVTNTVPQMQPFNAGIWLALESYALDHARSDQMRISVVTGPFLMADDPIRNGVLIPRSFWKVIAFIHDETREPCATGYTMSQEDFIRDEEFVFGRHQTTQTRIAAIEERAGLSFGPLAALDPFDGDEEGVDALLTDPAQIRYRRR
jgi:DNA/RNA endonuclease G (NUC1)